MVDFKLTISEKAGKSYQTVVSEPDSKMFMGKKIGDKVSGETINLAGYELLITGGSDSAGFPMRKDVSGSARKRILAVKGIGLKKRGKGTRQRKTVCGNTIHESISQINLQVVKEGSKKLADAFGSKEGEGKEGEEKAPEKTEEKPAEKKEEAPKEEVKNARTTSGTNSFGEEKQPEEKKAE
jgi:small subunit ribosomal protein S6e